MYHYLVLISSFLLLGFATDYRLADGAAPWWLVFPAIMSVFLIASSVDEINKMYSTRRRIK